MSWSRRSKKTITLELPNICLLSGADGVSLHEAEECWLKTYVSDGTSSVDYERFEGKGLSAEKLLSALDSLPMFQAQRAVVITGCDQLSKTSEALIESHASTDSSLALLLLSPKVDKRKKWVKIFQQSNRHWDFPMPKRGEWKGWMDERCAELGVEIGEDASAFLVEWIGDDPWRLFHELKKLSAYAADGERIQIRDVEALVSGIPMAEVFGTLDALFEGQWGVAFQGFHRLLTMKEPPLRLLALVIRHYRLLMHLRSLMSLGVKEPGELARRVGLSPYFVKRYIQQSIRWNTPALVRAFSLLRTCDEELKGESRLPAEIIFQKFLMELNHASSAQATAPLSP